MVWISTFNDWFLFGFDLDSHRLILILIQQNSNCFFRSLVLKTEATEEVPHWTRIVRGCSNRSWDSATPHETHIQITNKLTPSNTQKPQSLDLIGLSDHILFFRKSKSMSEKTVRHPRRKRAKHLCWTAAQRSTGTAPQRQRWSSKRRIKQKSDDSRPLD